MQRHSQINAGCGVTEVTVGEGSGATLAERRNLRVDINGEGIAIGPSSQNSSRLVCPLNLFRNKASAALLDTPQSTAVSTVAGEEEALMLEGRNGRNVEKGDAYE